MLPRMQFGLFWDTIRFTIKTYARTHRYGAAADVPSLPGVNVRNAMQAHSTPQCLPRGVAWDRTF